MGHTDGEHMQRIFRLIPSTIVKAPLRIDIAFPEALAYKKHPDELLFMVPPRDVETAAYLLRSARVTVYVGVDELAPVTPAVDDDDDDDCDSWCPSA
jgi:hypothetical protein